jgi:hypothetical protein
MHRDEMVMEECRDTWRAEARSRVNQEAKENGLTGDDALEFVQQRMQEIYEELRELGDGI